MSNTLLTTLDRARLREGYEAGFWREDTIYALAAERARREPHAPALRDAHRRVSYGDLVAAADALAAELRAAGLRRGQRVAVWLPSRLETAVALLACSRDGLVCCPSLHRDHTVAEVTDLLMRMRAAALVAQPGYGANATRHDLFAAIADSPHLLRVFRLDAPGTGPLWPGTADGSEDAAADTDPDSVVYLAFTSGTTGQPKGVMHSDNTLLANARAVAADWLLGTDDVITTLSPLSHNLGFGSLVLALLTGAELVINDMARGASLLDRLVETGTTYLVGVPTHAIDLLDELRRRGVQQLGLRGFRISGAAVPQAVISDLIAHGVTPQSGYGMTEASSHHYTLPNDPPERMVETSGRVCPGYEIQVFSREDPEKPLPPGEVGQIAGRGASLMLGYFDAQQATEDSFNRLGWFMTGDLGWVDEQGYIRITGRKKDVIIRGGHNIFPAKIEGLAMQHPAVLRAAALPVPDPRLGEKVCLAVMLRPGHAVAPEALLLHLDASGLSKYDQPEFFMEVAEMPLTASGKILKRTVATRLDAGELVPVPVRLPSIA